MWYDVCGLTEHVNLVYVLMEPSIIFYGLMEHIMMVYGLMDRDKLLYGVMERCIISVVYWSKLSWCMV